MSILDLNSDTIAAGNLAAPWVTTSAHQGLVPSGFDTSLAASPLGLAVHRTDINARVANNGNRARPTQAKAQIDGIQQTAFVPGLGGNLSSAASTLKSSNDAFSNSTAPLAWLGADQVEGSNVERLAAAQGSPIDPLTGQQVAANAYDAVGCTRVLWNDNPVAVLVARSGDWFKAVDPRGASAPKLQVMPRGLTKSGAMFGDQKVVTDNPAQWTSRYGSVVVSNIGTVVFEGMNEKGLAAHSLSLPETQYGDRDASRQGLQMGLWVPYILDNASTVEEALSLLPKIQPVPVVVDGFAMKLSLSIEDASGDSAVIEYLDTDGDIKTGELVVRHGRQYTVASNATLDASFKELSKYNFENATRNLPLPGNANPIDRFIRASFFGGYLSKMTPRNITEARAALMSVIRNVSNPIGAPGTVVGLNDETDFRVLSDLTNRQLIFDNPRNLNVLYTDLNRLNFSAGTGIRTIDPQDPQFVGDVTHLYRYTNAAVPGLVGSAEIASPGRLSIKLGYKASRA